MKKKLFLTPTTNKISRMLGENGENIYCAASYLIKRKYCNIQLKYNQL